MSGSEGIRCYNYIPEKDRIKATGEPLKAVVITSVRDVGAADMNGKEVQINGERAYMQGLLEAVIRDINEGRKETAQAIRIVGVINDDCSMDEARGRLEDFPVAPTAGRPWIHPLNLRDHRNELVTANTQNIPSDFRWLPGRAVDERAEKKLVFENQVERVAREMGADILVSDHLMLRIQNLLDQTRGWIGRIVNIHPAMTRADHPFALRGPTPTQDALDRANGFRVINAKTGETERVERYGRTGATFHIVNPVIDAGMVLADGELTPVYPTDSPQELRYRNYPTKIDVFNNGMDHYAKNIYPNLGYTGVDWLNGHRPTDSYVAYPHLLNKQA
jgi:folate-dependent phosphoribosylglycinamide formyltransferase PurN